MAAPRDYQRLVEEVAALLGAPATLEDRDFGLVAFCAHEGDAADADDVRARSILSRTSSPQVKAWFESFGISRAAEPVRIPADPATGVRARLCLPARHRGVTYGYMWLLDPGVPDAEPWAADDLAAAFALAGRAGDLLAEEAHAGAELGERLRDLLAGADEARAVAALEAAGARVGVGGYAVVVVRDAAQHVPDPLAVHALPYVVAAYADADAAAHPVGELVALVRSPRPAADTARRIAKGRRAARGGVSATVAELRGASPLLGQARAAARAAAAFPERAPVSTWTDLGPYRMLARLAEAPGGAAPDPAVAVLLTPQHAELARTAEIYLDQAAHATKAAELLAIHRQTLYYRLSRVEELTGLDLSNGEHRLLVHMALKAARLAGTDGSI
ncbi:PucR family transcriptional regulator [Yinghuangia seranimata]|uniref:PucR family transcriptional regulator n=1 Tax=Yinghuangia seranimata TaxID=408067 RepID=UPI00248B9FFE|nr:helix-turn-helix domain-containing protein [Yinghuangia seranimata]MDI2125791.1 helix-turn-helix domain-containing protein [Yinghuangia seranimata]